MQKNREDAGDSSNDQADESDVSQPAEADEAETGSDAEPKRGERPGNLRRRSEWFQKRHGGG
jgi:hypothetical protein